VRGLQWAEGILALPEAAPRTVARARSLFTAGILAWSQRRYDLARSRMEESVAIFRERGQQGGVAEAALWWTLLSSASARARPPD
jgi:hypothetical protein